MTQTIDGERALAWGAVEAGVGLVTGYPGSPGTNTFNAIAEMAKDHDHHTEWCLNEQIAIDMAAGASQGGKRALLCIKSVGMNVALDTLMVVNMTGVHAGLVIVMGDDPGAWGSQNEQDTRPLGPLAEVPMLEPATPSEGREMIKWAFEYSEKLKSVVILRITRSYSIQTESLSNFNPPTQKPSREPDREPMSWISALRTTEGNHTEVHQKIEQATAQFSDLPFNRIDGTGKKGIIASGMVHTKLLEALEGADTSSLSILKLSALYPLPKKLIANFLAKCDEILVFEEVDPYIEDGIKTIGYDAGATPPILGKRTDHVASVGELFRWQMQKALDAYLPGFLPTTRYTEENWANERPFRQNHCADCPFPEVLAALRNEAQILGQNPFVSADPGCIVMASQMLDTKLSMGSAIGVACGLSKTDITERTIAICGDSAFYHGGINALIHARATGATPIVMVLDNGGARTTGGQTTPDRGVQIAGESGPQVTIRDIALACGASTVREVAEEDTEDQMRSVFREALQDPTLNFIIVRKQCKGV
ncbi:MAG: thiamine pyrophosphate-dependent enzyme [Candidatus Latescibacteria bacterium]|jgi:indolepyruvate ferredoxin oxidoreductase alpha subunit|nr:thiamine pyrophosphate-dependent enzyme [Candidatus Latescibacterota bacterium]